MDYDFNAAQRELLNRIDQVVVDVGGIDRAFAISVEAGYDAELDVALERSNLLEGAGLLERILVAERLAELGAATTFGLRAVLTYDTELPSGSLAVATADRRGPFRYGGAAKITAVIQDDDVILASEATDALRPIRSGFGYPYAQLESTDITGLRLAGAGPRWRNRLALVLAAEISGNAARAIDRTSEHMKTRIQFKQPLATFQALRHRIAEAAVSADATRWLVREAAYHDDARSIDLAASYAAQTAAHLVPELVQLCGARSFTISFGLHVFTMRLGGLRLELGGPDRLANSVLARSAT